MTKPKKKSNKRKRRTSFQDAMRRNERMAKELQARFSKKSDSADERLYPSVQRGTGTIMNPSKHDSTIKRCVQGYLNKLNVPDEPSKCIQRKWLCAFCGMQTCVADMGDLFGPYYVTDLVFPERFLLKRADQQESTNGTYSDVWFHGSCALWTPNLMFFAGKFPHLSDAIKRAWRHNCIVCRRIGANIPIESHKGYVHYPCAVYKKYQLIELTLTCKPPPTMIICRPIRLPSNIVGAST